MTDDSTPDDAALMARAREGDEEAFRILFERHAGSMEARIHARLREGLSRRLSTADVLQEARIVAFERRASFDPERGTFKSWINGIVEMKVREFRRRFGGTAKRSAHREVSRGGRTDTANFAGRAPSPSEMAVAGELADRARKAREALSPDYQEVLRLAHEEGLNLKEAAERMGRSHEAVKKLYGRAFARFKQALESLGGIP